MKNMALRQRNLLAAAEFTAGSVQESKAANKQSKILPY
jgi:hypothetical protein